MEMIFYKHGNSPPLFRKQRWFRKQRKVGLSKVHISCCHQYLYKCCTVQVLYTPQGRFHWHQTALNHNLIREPSFKWLPPSQCTLACCKLNIYLSSLSRLTPASVILYSLILPVSENMCLERERWAPDFPTGNCRGITARAATLKESASLHKTIESNPRYFNRASDCFQHNTMCGEKQTNKQNPSRTHFCQSWKISNLLFLFLKKIAVVAYTTLKT